MDIYHHAFSLRFIINLTTSLQFSLAINVLVEATRIETKLENAMIQLRYAVTLWQTNNNRFNQKSPDV